MSYKVIITNNPDNPQIVEHGSPKCDSHNNLFFVDGANCVHAIYVAGSWLSVVEN